MEDVADGLHSAWKETLRGLKEGYKLTKKALKKIPPIIDAKGDEQLSHSDRRRMFQAKYAASVPPSRTLRGGVLTHPEESDYSDAESSDSEILTDEQVKGLIDCKFFDPEYDPVVYEVEHLPEACPKDEDAIKAESTLVDQKILVLRQQCDVVSTTLKKRVLAHHQAFVTGIEEMRSLNDSLFTTSSDCKKCRNAVRRAKGSVISQLEIIAQKRSVDNCNATVQTLEAMQKMVCKRAQLQALLTRGKIVEAKRFLEDEKEIEMEDTLNNIICMRDILEEWKGYVKQPKKIHDHLELVFTTCFTQVFIADAYQNAVESSYSLSSSAECCSTVESLLWKTAVQIMTRSLTEVSSIKEESAPIADIVCAVEPEHLVLGVSSMAAKWMDFFYIFTTIRKLHHDEVVSFDSVQSSVSAFNDDHNIKDNPQTVHRDLLTRLQRLGPRLARDLMMKLILMISGCTKTFVSLDVDHLVHLFVVVDLIVEGMTLTLEPDKSDVQQTRKELLDILCSALRRSIFLPDIESLVQAMNNDSWEMSDVSVSSIGVLKGLDTKYHDQRVQLVRQYLIDDHENDSNAIDTRGPLGVNGSHAQGTAPGVNSAAVRENPFRHALLIQPHDTSSWVESVTFGQYWASTKINPSRPSEDIKGCNNAVTTESLNINSDIVVSPPTVIATSAIRLFNMLMSTQLRVVVRFPALAERALSWCEEWVSFYLFTVVDNFISISRSIPVEEQGDFSPLSQKTLRDLRQSAEIAVDAQDGLYVPVSRGSVATADHNRSSVRFPPRVIDRIRSLFVSETHQYALGNRALACESSRAVVSLYECVLRSFYSLLEEPSILDYYLKRAQAMYTTIEEGLHVCLHRLSEAIFPMPKVCDEIAHLKVRNDEVEVSSYVKEMLTQLRQLHQRRYPMPTPDLETLFIKRSIFAVQSMAIREYSKLSKKINDLLAMQLQVDAQNFAQQAAITFGKANVVRPRHVLTVVQTGFFLQDHAQSLSWIEREHEWYNAVDILNWFSCGDKIARVELEVKLKRELKHTDCLPLQGF